MQCQKCNLEMRMEKVVEEDKMQFICKKCGKEEIINIEELKSYQH